MPHFELLATPEDSTERTDMQYNGCWSGILIIGSGILTAVALSLLTRRLFSAADLRDGHESTGTLLAVVGTMYAVLLGLIVVDAMSRFDKTCENVQMESNCLADVFLLADRLPQPYRERVREQCRTYARQVVELEWNEMQRAQMSIAARTTALELAQSLHGFEPETESQKVVFPAILEQLRQMWDHRRDRAGSVQYGIPTIEWVALIVGAVVTLFLCCLFHVGSQRLQLVVTGLTALVIGLNLYLVCLFGYPFAGDLSVSSRPFDIDIAIFEGAYVGQPAQDGKSASGKTAVGP